MNDMLQILGFDIDINQIPVKDIEEKSKALSRKQKSFFLKKFNTENEFLTLLYHLIFIERLEKREIAQIIGYKSAVNLHHLLYDLGWYSEQVDNKVLEDAKELSKSFNTLDPEHEKLRLALKKVVDINQKSYQKLGFQSGEEYVRVFYYLKCVKGLSPIQISLLFNSTWSMTEHRIKKLGFNQTHAEGMVGKRKRGLQDYGKTRRAGQSTRRKTQYENFAPTSSSNEEYFRRQLSDFIYSHIDPKRYEIVVGVNNTGIINPFEVDIPVIIYEPKQNAIFRLAIEYKDPHVHDPQKDLERERLLTAKGWNYLEVIDIPIYSNDRIPFDRKIHEVCEYIKDVVEVKLSMNS